MIKISSGCQLVEQISESAYSFVYRAVRDRDNHPVILKILKDDFPTPVELMRYRHEFEVLRHLGQNAGIS